MKLVERDADIRHLINMLQESSQGRGRIAIVDGTVSTGKTRLLRILADEASSSGTTTLTATAARSESKLKFGVVTQLFSNASLAQDSATKVGDLLDEATRMQELSDPAGDIISPAHAQIFHGLHQELAKLAENQTVLIGVDDIHNSDPFSLQFIVYLARRIQYTRILLVVNELMGSVPAHPLPRAELLRQPHCRRIRLAPLSRTGVAKVLAATLGQDAARRLAPVCHAFSGGNPLLLRSLIEDCQSGPERQDARSARELTAGDAYRQAVLACLQRCEPEMADAAHALAVLEASNSYQLAGRLLGVSTEEAARLKHALVRSGLLADEGFRHPVAHSAVLTDLAPRRRAKLHLRAAQLLHDEGAPAPVVATHLLAAGYAQQPWGVGVLRQAAVQALHQDDAELASAYLELAKRDCVGEDDLTAVTILLAQVEWRLNPSASLRHVIPLTSSLRQRRLSPDQAMRLIKHLLRHGRLDEAEEALAWVGEMYRGPEPKAAVEYQAFRLWLSCSYPAVARRAAPTLEPPAEPTAPVPSPAAESRLESITLLHTVLSGAATDEALIEVEQTLRDLRLSDETLESAATAITALNYADRLDTAAVWCASLLEEATRRRVPAWCAVLSAIMADITLRQGDLAATRRHAYEAMAHMSTESWGVGIGSPLAALMVVARELADFDVITELFNEPVPEGTFATRSGLHYQHARGLCYLAMDRPHAALRAFRACGERMQEWGHDIPAVVPWRGDAAWALLALDQHYEARVLAEEQLALLPPVPTRTRGLTLRVLAAASDPVRRPRLLEEAVHSLQSAGDRLELAKALADLSHVTDAPDHARDLMGRAQQAARECGARPLLARLYAEAGLVEPEPSRQSGIGEPGNEPVVLSEAERRVAALVSEGLTNQDVADKLFITVSTVEQHLTRVYRKLNVNGRRNLPKGLLLVSE